MVRWNDVHEQAPELATQVRSRFETTGLGLLATLRRDGSPRLSGIEPWFGLGELWLGMMPDCRKARDLQRDPRFALHAATVDTTLTEGDAKVAGRAREVTDPDEMAASLACFTDATGTQPPPGPMHLFSLDVGELVFVSMEGDRLRMRWWTPEAGERTVART